MTRLDKFDRIYELDRIFRSRTAPMTSCATPAAPKQYSGSATIAD